MIKTNGKMPHKGRLYYVENNWKKKKTKHFVFGWSATQAKTFLCNNFRVFRSCVLAAAPLIFPLNLGQAGFEAGLADF